MSEFERSGHYPAGKTGLNWSKMTNADICDDLQPQWPSLNWF
jgi:hypothetical protein